MIALAIDQRIDSRQIFLDFGREITRSRMGRRSYRLSSDRPEQADTDEMICVPRSNVTALVSAVLLLTLAGAGRCAAVRDASGRTIADNDASRIARLAAL